MRCNGNCFQKIVKMQKNIYAPLLRARTFGCKVNFCDTNALVEVLADAGFRRAGKGEKAELEIVNTCTVTARSVQKARGLIRRIRAENPLAFILVTGCAVRMGEPALRRMPEADHLAGDLDSAAEIACHRFGLPAPRPVSGGIDPRRTRTFIKIQDGCEAFCTYCIVPHVRGAERSLPAAEVIERVKSALDSGHREIVLSGTHLGRYADASTGGLPGLLRLIDDIGGEFRVRLSSIEPLEVSDELLDVMGSSKIFCPHFHLPLQSGSDRMLAAMGRPYSISRFLETVDRIRASLENPAITTDLMVGFPGEEEADHAETLRAVARARFARTHVFVFSPRPGTPAAKMQGAVNGPTARRRSREVRAASAETAAAFRRGLVGRTVEVLPEKSRGGVLEGFCRRYQRVRFKDCDDLLGRLLPVYIIGTGEGGDGILEGRPVYGREETGDA